MLVAIDSQGKIQLPKEIDCHQVVLEQIGGALHILPQKRDVKALYLEISSTCNLSCKICMRKVRKRVEEGLMDKDLYHKILEDTRPLPDIERIHFGGYGEPLLHPYLPLFIEKAKKRGLKVGLSSNGTLLSKEMARDLIDAGLDSITISLDSTDPRRFQDLRLGGELSSIQENLRILKEEKRERKSINPMVEAEMVAMKSTIQDLKELKKRAGELGILRIIITHLLAHSEKMWREVLYQKEEEIYQEIPYWSLEKEDSIPFGRLTLPRKAWGSERDCSFIKNRAMVINWQGEVSPCYALMYQYPYHLYGREKEVTPYILGDLKEEDLLSIWKKEEYLRFRKKVEDYRFPSCQDCSIGEKCTYARENEDCWGNSPSCADCLWSQRLIICP